MQAKRRERLFSQAVKSKYSVRWLFYFLKASNMPSGTYRLADGTTLTELCVEALESNTADLLVCAHALLTLVRYRERLAEQQYAVEYIPTTERSN